MRNAEAGTQNRKTLADWVKEEIEKIRREEGRPPSPPIPPPLPPRVRRVVARPIPGLQLPTPPASPLIPPMDEQSYYDGVRSRYFNMRRRIACPYERLGYYLDGMSESYVEDFLDRLPGLVVDWLKENNYVIQYGEVVPASRSKHSNTPSEIKEYVDKLKKQYADELMGPYRRVRWGKGYNPDDPFSSTYKIVDNFVGTIDDDDYFYNRNNKL